MPANCEVCEGCAGDVNPLRAVTAADGKRWHWRCYHVEVDTIALPDGTSRLMTHAEWQDHQTWADRWHDGRGNQRSR